MVQFLSINFFFLNFFNFCWVFQNFRFFVSPCAYNSNVVCPADTTRTAPLTLHCNSTSLQQEVFSNPSLGTMVTQIAELCMAGHFKKRHVISVSNNKHKIHKNEPQLYLGQWQRTYRFCSIHLATISPLCAFHPLQWVVTCVTPCSFAFTVC